MKKILITGGCGFVGHHAVENFLKKTDWEILIFDKLTYAASGLDRVRDIKAFNDEVHLALTGASSEPVLRNAKYIGRFAKDKLWEYRILVIPKINEEEIQPLCRFISDIDANLPVCFLAFRPNYVLEHHPGAAAELLDRCVNIAKRSGLKNAYWSGQTGIPGVISALQKKVVSAYQTAGGRLAGAYAYVAGCRTHARNCAACSSHQACLVKRYVPQIQT